MGEQYVWVAVAVIALVTAAIRFLPFWIWSGDRKPPRMVEKLGGMLPYAIMGMLVVYCLKGVTFRQAADFLPSLCSCIVVAVCHLWKRNTLISILAGTVCYMCMVQLVF